MKQRQATAAEEAAPHDRDPLAEMESLDPKELLAAAARVTREHPHVALATAGLVGFLLGGGLTPRVLGVVAMTAGRRYASHAMRDLIASTISEQLGGHAAT